MPRATERTGSLRRIADAGSRKPAFPADRDRAMLLNAVRSTTMVRLEGLFPTAQPFTGHCASRPIFSHRTGCRAISPGIVSGRIRRLASMAGSGSVPFAQASRP